MDFLSTHQLAGGRQPRRLLARERGEERREEREPGQDENSTFSQQSNDGVLSAPHSSSIPPSPRHSPTVLIGSEGAMSTQASLSYENYSLQGAKH